MVIWSGNLSLNEHHNLKKILENGRLLGNILLAGVIAFEKIEDEEEERWSESFVEICVKFIRVWSEEE